MGGGAGSGLNQQVKLCALCRGGEKKLGTWMDCCKL